MGIECAALWIVFQGSAMQRAASAARELQKFSGVETRVAPCLHMRISARSD
jgi:hypothetical protein